MHEARKGLTGDPRNAHMSNFPHMGSAKGLAGLRTGDYGLRTGDYGLRTGDQQRFMVCEQATMVIMRFMLNQKSIWGVNVLNLISELGCVLGKSSSVQPTFVSSKSTTNIKLHFLSWGVLCVLGCEL